MTLKIALNAAIEPIQNLEGDPPAARGGAAELGSNQPEQVAGSGGATKDSSPQAPEKQDAHGNGRGSQAAQMIKLVTFGASVEFFHTPGGEPYARVPIGRHREVLNIVETEFKDWLAGTLYKATGIAASDSALGEAIRTLKAIAIHDATEQQVYVRLAEYESCIYLDLADELRRVVKISAQGWEVVTDYPVKFIRPRGMQALPEPVCGRHIDDLRSFLNIGDNDQFVLLVGWLVSAFRPAGPYPILVLQGGQGSSKSTVTRLLKCLVDPNSVAIRSAPRNIEDLMISAANGWCLAFDNFSDVTEWLSDALCRMSTGGGYSTRRLYSNGGEVLFDAKRPVIINGIDVGISRGDLLERALILTLPSISSEGRLTEDAIWRNFAATQGSVLGALLDAVSCGLRRLPDVRLPRLPRMADFAIWVTACEPAFGWADGTFLEAYERHRRDTNELALEGSVLYPRLLALLVENHKWSGTATELLSWLNGSVEPEVRRNCGWPKTTGALSGTLRRLVPNLKSVGIMVQFEKTSGSNSQKIIEIENTKLASRVAQVVRLPQRKVVVKP